MKVRRLLLVAVPILWVALAFAAQQAMGRFSLIDPDYYYLLSALDLAEWRSIGMYHHPGTTAEVFGALMIRAMYFFSPGPAGLQQTVLLDPETYLAAFHLGVGVLNGIGLLVLGLTTTRATRRVWLGVVIQLSVFVSPVIFEESVSRFNAEPFMLFASLLFVSLMIIYITHPAADEGWLMVGFAAICGFGLATKFTFVPTVLIPFLLLKGNRNKALFAAATAVATIVFTLPIADHYRQLADWTYTVSSHTGIYGGGADGVVDPVSYRRGLSILFNLNPTFDLIVAFAGLVIAGVAARAYQRGEGMPQGRAFRTLGAVALSQAISFLLVAKFASFANVNRYLLSSYCLLGLTLWLSVEAIRGLESTVPTLVKRVLVTVLTLPVLYRLAAAPRQVAYEFKGMNAARTTFEAREAQLSVLNGDQFKGFARIYDPGVRLPAYAMVQASFYSTTQVEGLAKAYPTVFFCLPDCTAGDWKSKQFIGADTSRQFSASELAEKFADRMVLISGNKPTVEVVKFKD